MSATRTHNGPASRPLPTEVAPTMEQDLDKLATLFYVAHALPLVRKLSEEAGILTELALSELILSLIARRNTLRSHTNLVDYLNYSIEDVQAIAPAGATALEAAIRELREVAYDVDAEERRPC